MDPNGDPNVTYPDMSTGGGGTDDGGGQSGYCAGKGPPIVVGDTGTGAARCTGQVAAAAFRYGLCVCSSLSYSAPLTTDAFDSSATGVMTLSNGGSVGLNTNLNGSGKLTVGGTLQVTGAVTVRDATVGVDALISDRWQSDASADIKRNASIGGDIIGNGTFKVAGVLTYPNGKTLTAPNAMIGSQVRAAVTVPTPCDCSPTSRFNIASYVTERATSNDNAAIGLSAAKLTNYSGDQVLNLTCGRFYLDRINGTGKITVNVSGRTALFIGGDVNLSDQFVVNLQGNGELDLFLNGGLTSSAPLKFGDSLHPARVRLYMGGNRNINLSAGSVIGGNIYAPESALVTSGSIEVFGAIFVNSFNPSASVTIHHDIAILKAGDDCGGAGGTGGTNSCRSCTDCGSQACVGGKCGSCTTSSDCCSPLQCRGGKCIIEIG